MSIRPAICLTDLICEPVEHKNPRYLHISANNLATGDLGLTNEGFKGMGLKNGLRYDFSVMYRLSSGTN